MPPMVRQLLTIASFAVLWPMFSTDPCATIADAATSEVSGGQTVRAIPESASGLKSQLEAILKAAKEGDSKQVDDLIGVLEIPGSVNWFAATFGEGAGQKLAATYEASWKDYKYNLESMFGESGAKKHTQVFVKEFPASLLARNDAFIQSILRNAKGPLVLYTAGAGKHGESDSLPGVYIFSQGYFRVVNWRTFYDLPGVKPMRIRVGRQVAQVTHHVDPIPPPDALRQQVHGTVMVHVIIDRDGNVAQREAVSGPPELFDAAVDAASQWRFKPTILNGDPVEVDTTIPITFLEAVLKPYVRLSNSP